MLRVKLIQRPEVIFVAVMRFKFASLLCGVMALLCACGGTRVMPYDARPNMRVEQAMTAIEKLTMTQHSAWRPDYVVFEPDFLGWGMGTVTTQSARAIAVPVGNSAVAVGRGSGTTRNVGERVYYGDIRQIQLLSWRRKGRQWYVASVVDRRDNITHLLRTRYVEDAQSYIDALYVLVGARTGVSTRGSISAQ
jgi:hypothetical protein